MELGQVGATRPVGGVTVTIETKATEVNRSAPKTAIDGQVRGSPRFDEEIHAPIRLRICAIAAAADAVEFSVVRDRLEVADSVVSKHLSRLEAVGYVQLDKLSTGSHPRTWVSLTTRGRGAFEGHIAALRQIAEGAGL